jgi:hypothetical protein
MAGEAVFGRGCIRARLYSGEVDIVGDPLLYCDPLLDLHAYVCAAFGFSLITGINGVYESVHFVQ